MIYSFYPSDAYIKSLARVPKKLGLKSQKTCEYVLVIIHYNSQEFESKRWTSRTRDIYNKKAKMLHFDMCSAYLFEISRFEQFKKLLQDNYNNKESFMFLAYRLFGDVWKSTVEAFSYENVSNIEYHDYPNLVL